jgi:hypothetical protein
MRGFYLAMVVWLMLALPISWASTPSPLIIVYTPQAPGYGAELRRIVEEGFDADVVTLTDPEIFRMAIHFPNVKAVVVSLLKDLDEGIGPSLEWFFSQGGGLVGLGFAGARLATENASETVFPLFGSAYRPGKYDAATRSFRMTHVKEDDDEISRGVPTFSISTQKLVLSYDSSANQYLPTAPEEGEYKILYREETSGAPSLVKYRNGGVSVTFACFGADDFERGANYYGRFTNATEFRTLFTRALNWVWNDESKYDSSTLQVGEYFQEKNDNLTSAKGRAEDLLASAKMQRITGIALTVALAAVGIAVVYWATFLKVQ